MRGRWTRAAARMVPRRSDKRPSAGRGRSRASRSADFYFLDFSFLTGSMTPRQAHQRRSTASRQAYVTASKATRLAQHFKARVAGGEPAFGAFDVDFRKELFTIISMGSVSSAPPRYWRLISQQLSSHIFASTHGLKAHLSICGFSHCFVVSILASAGHFPSKVTISRRPASSSVSPSHR